METKQSTGSAERQAGLWGARAEDWGEVQERQARPLYEAVLARAEIGSGTRLLDAGCGAGGFVALASARGAIVSGFDATPELLAIARRRSPKATIEQSDLESLSFADGAFDVVTGFNSFQYAASPARAIGEAKRVVRRGGHVFIATWGKLEDCESAVTMVALKPLMPPPPPGAEGPFALSEDGALRAFASRSGLEPIEVVDVDMPMVYPDHATAMRGLLSAGPISVAIRTSGEDKVRAAMTAAIEPYRTATGGYHMKNKFRILVATG